MPGFDALYRQTITIFNRDKHEDGDIWWYPRTIHGVHLIIDRSSSWDSQGGRAMDSARLHIRYVMKHGEPYIGDVKWLESKEWQARRNKRGFVTFSFGNNDDFDFFMEGEYPMSTLYLRDSMYKKGFYSHVKGSYSNVFAITGVSKKNLIPHFEITGR